MFFVNKRNRNKIYGCGCYYIVNSEVINEML